MSSAGEETAWTHLPRSWVERFALSIFVVAGGLYGAFLIVRDGVDAWPAVVWLLPVFIMGFVVEYWRNEPKRRRTRKEAPSSF